MFRGVLFGLFDDRVINYTGTLLTVQRSYKAMAFAFLQQLNLPVHRLPRAEVRRFFERQGHHGHIYCKGSVHVEYRYTTLTMSKFLGRQENWCPLQSLMSTKPDETATTVRTHRRDEDRMKNIRQARFRNRWLLE